MLDENLPSFLIKPSVDNELNSTIYHSAEGSDPEPEYILVRPDPRTPAARNCYDIALCDPYNPDVVYGEVLVQPEWTQPTLSAAELRALNGAPAAPTPVIPNSFVIQLYSPDQQVTVKRPDKTWGTSSTWDFLLPERTFRVPSASTLDRSQNDPTISDIVPKIAFSWKRDSRFTKDITCYMSGKSTDTKKTKEGDITVAMFRGGKHITIYEPNLHRVEVEDKKGLEVVLLLGAQAIKDLYISPGGRDMFNLSVQTIGRKNSMSLVGRKNSSGIAGITAPRKNSNPLVPASQVLHSSSRPHANSNPDPRTQFQIEAEAEALRAALEAEKAEEERERKAREKQVKREQREIEKMLEAEERARKQKEAEDRKETERLKKIYGVQGETAPALPPRRPQSQMLLSPPSQSDLSSNTNAEGGPQMLPYNSAQYSSSAPYQRPTSTPSFPPPPSQPFPYQRNNGSSYHNVLSGPSGPTSNARPHHGASASGPYLQAPGGLNFASMSSFFTNGHRGDSGQNNMSTGERRKLATKKRSVHF